MAKTSDKYFKVYDWMLGLGLTGDEVLALAYIHSLTEHGRSFYGSVGTIADLIGKGRMTASALLSRLVKRGLLTKNGDPRDGKPSVYVTCSKIEHLPARKSSTPRSKIEHLPARKSSTPRSKIEHNNNKDKDNNKRESTIAGASPCPLDTALALSPFNSENFKKIWNALITSPGFTGKTYNQLVATSRKLAKAGEQQAEKMCIDAIEVGASYVRNFKS